MTMTRVLSIIVCAALVLGACGDLGRKTTAHSANSATSGAGAGSRKAAAALAAHGTEPEGAGTGAGRAGSSGGEACRG